MDASTIVLHVVGDGDAEVITPSCTDNRARVLAVDEQACLLVTTIGSTGSVGNRQAVRDSVASSRVLLIKVGGNAVTAVPA